MNLVHLHETIYPESDGAPMGETEWHVLLLSGLLHALRGHFSSRPEVHVGANLFIYYEEGEPERVVCPDLFVAFGAKPGLRRTWKTWEEGFFPQVVIELASPSTRVFDLGSKRGLYEELGVEEYFVFDPLRDLEGPQLRGWRLEEEGYARIAVEADHEVRTLRSKRLGLLLQEEGEAIRLIESDSGCRIPFPEEEQEARRAEQEARRAEQEARQRAEVEIIRLRSELEKLRRKP